MTGPFVQVPVSLLEDALRSLDLDAAHPDTVKELWALLSHQTPTAEACCSRPGDPNWHTADGSHVVPPDVEEDTPVSPPRIADMVPGTTLDEALRWTVRRDRHGNTFLRRHDRSGAYVECWPRDIDPSTIRDITPPKEKP